MTYKFGICSLVKDEHKFLAEWIRWHLSVGFEVFHLWEDYGSKSHSSIASLFPGRVFLHPIAEVLGERETAERCDNKQSTLFPICAEMYKSEIEWLAFIDPDEYIMFKPGWSLESLCSEFSRFPGILLKWRNFGASGRIENPGLPVMEAYTEPVQWQDSIGFSIKSIAHLPKDPGFLTNHEIQFAISTNGKPGSFNSDYSKAWINHYVTKSWEDWVIQVMERGDVSAGNRKIDKFFTINPDLLPQKENLLQELVLTWKDPRITTFIASDCLDFKYPYSGSYHVLMTTPGTPNTKLGWTYTGNGVTNTLFSSVSVLLWISKNMPDTEYIGFVGAGRYFKHFYEKQELEILDTCSGATLGNVQVEEENVRQEFEREGSRKDWIALREVFECDMPEWEEEFHNFEEGKEKLQRFMIICKRSLFKELCEFVEKLVYYLQARLSVWSDSDIQEKVSKNSSDYPDPEKALRIIETLVGYGVNVFIRSRLSVRYIDKLIEV